MVRADGHRYRRAGERDGDVAAAGAMSQQTAVRITAQTIAVDDVEAEIAQH
jgi:hypothetical protein